MANCFLARRFIRASLPISMGLTLALIMSIGVTQGPAHAETTATVSGPKSSAPPKVEQTTAPDVVSAQVGARAQGVRVEVLSERTEVATTWANPDGTFTTDTSTGPIRVADKAAKGGWRDLDYTLVKNYDGTVGPKSGYVPLTLSGQATAAQVSKNGVVTATAKTGDIISFGWDGALPAPVLSGSKATYKDVQENVDYVVELTATGFEQYFILKAKPTRSNFALRLPLLASGLTSTREPGGALKFTNAQKRWVGTIPAPAMWDSSKDPRSGLPKLKKQLSMALETAEDGRRDLVLTPDPASLQDTAVIYPIVIDPAVTLATTSDALVRSDFPTTNYDGDVQLQAGTYNGGASIARSFLNFSSAGWMHTKVIAATLKLYEVGSYNCTLSTLSVYPSSVGPWPPTWNSQPSYNTSASGSISTAKGFSSACAAGWVSVAVTNVAAYWANGTSSPPIVGMTLRASESVSTGWKRFNSSNATTNKPSLSVTYDRYPSTPSTPTMAPVASYNSMYYTKTATPTFTSKVADADGGTTRATFQVRAAASSTSPILASCTTGYVAAGASASCAVPALTNGSTYYVNANGYDGVVSSKAISGFMAFKVATSAPPTSAILCPTPYANGSWQTSVPSAPLTCTVTVPSTGGVAAAVSVRVKVDSGTETTTALVQGAGGTKSVTVPATSGSHSIQATVVAATGLTTTSNYGLGYGAASLTAPASGTTTTDTLRVSAAAPPSGSSTVTATLKWRPANSASTAWNPVIGVPVKTGDGTVPVTVSNYQWSTLSASSDNSTGETVTLNSRLPVLLEYEMCFYYSTGRTLCTADVTSPATVLRVPHAFGDGFPVAAAGEGELAQWTGELGLTASDVSVATVGGPLSISRYHSTFAGPADSLNGVFGPGWSAGFEGVGGTGYQVVDNTTIDGTISFIDGSSDPLVFQGAGGAAPTGEYIPTSDMTIKSNASVTVSGSGSSRVLSFTASDGTESKWVPVNAVVTPIVWAPLSVTQPAEAGTTKYTITGGRVSRILAPFPAGVTCPDSGALNPGCSALYLDYATSTTATTGAEGTVANQVAKVRYETFDPASTGSGAMTTVDVATYAYDDAGRLRTFTSLPSGLTTKYTYVTLGTDTALASITKFGYATTSFNYDTSPVRLRSVTRGGATAGGATTTATSFVYGIDPTTAGLPSVSASEIAKWQQTRVPTIGFAVFGPDHPVSSTSPSNITTTADWKHAQLAYADADGYAVNSATYGAGQWLLTAEEYDADGSHLSSLTAADINDAKDSSSAGLPFVVAAQQSVTRHNAEVASSDPNNPLVAKGTHVLDEWSAPAWSTLADGSTAWVRTHTHTAYDEGAPNSGISPDTLEPYFLPTTVTVGVASSDAVSTDPNATLPADLEILSVTKSGYDPIDGSSATSNSSGWTLGTATKTTVVFASASDNIVRQVRYDATGDVVEAREPLSEGSDAGTTLNIRYTAGPNTADPACGNKAQWAGMACWSGPPVQPESGNDIPDSRVTAYSKWLRPIQVVETSGLGATQATRTTDITYLADGRDDTRTVSVVGIAGSTSLPTSKALYDGTTLTLSGTATLSASTPPSSGTVTSKVEWASDLWGRRTSYTNSLGDITTTTYAAPGVAGAGNVSAVANAKGTSTYFYDGIDADGAEESRGVPTKLTVSGVGTFGASYNADGLLLTEMMPGGLTQSYNYDAQRRVSSLTYTGDVTVDGATTKGTWLSYSRDYDSAGRVAREYTPDGGSDLSEAGYSNSYNYDRAGRLTDVTSATTDGAGQVSCAHRTYAFDKQGNRTSLTQATATDVCPTSAGSSTSYAYDAYSRQLTGANDSGAYEYDSFGRQTTLPAVDAPNPGGGDISISYFDTDLVHSIKQGASTSTFSLDPGNHRLQRSAVTGQVTTTTLSHYGEPGDNPSWVTQTSGSTVQSSTYYGGFSGLAAVVSDDGTTTTAALEIKDLGGSVVASAAIPASGNAAAISGYSTSDEYGNSATAGASTGVVRYGWEGGARREIDDAGLLLMGVRVYNPTTGRFTSMDPIAGGNENAYNYPDDPINASDLTGMLAWWKKALVKGLGFALVGALGAIVCATPGVGWVMCVAMSMFYNAIAGGLTAAIIASLDGKSNSQVKNAMLWGFIKGLATGMVSGAVRYLRIISRAWNAIFRAISGRFARLR